MFFLDPQRINEHFFSVLNNYCLVCSVLCLFNIDVPLLNRIVSSCELVFKIARLLLLLLTF